MKANRTRIALAALALAAPSIAQAHPGLHMHGFGDGLAHPLTGLDHLLAMVAVGFGGDARRRRALVGSAAFVSVMMLGALWRRGAAIARTWNMRSRLRSSPSVCLSPSTSGPGRLRRRWSACSPPSTVSRIAPKRRWGRAPVPPASRS